MAETRFSQEVHNVVSNIKLHQEKILHDLYEWQ